MKKLTKILSLLMIIMSLSACVSGLNSYQKREMSAYRAKKIAVEPKSEVLGVVLGLLPGGGSFYTENYGIGVVDLIFWPLSILWDPINGYNGAESINYYATKEAVNYEKNEKLKKLDNQLISKEINNTEYLVKKREIESSYDYNY